MAFNLTAQLNLQGPSNVKQIAAQIRKDLGNINANVQFKLDPGVARNVAALSSSLKTLNTTFATTVRSANAASAAIKSFGNSINSVKIGSVPQQLNQTVNAINKLNKTSATSVKGLSDAASEMREFGKQAGLAIRRFVAFSTVTSVIYGVTNAINDGVQAFIDYDRELVKLQQVTGESASGLSKLQTQISELAVRFGVSSKELTQVASTLAQAGLSARETEKALKALALSSLAPSFDSMNETVEGSIALMRQFGIQAEDLESALGAVNTVAARFAVESSDIITAIQRTGSVFATASKGVSEGKDALNEFIAVFTSVRATTRESAETIATGLRTIFTRLQRSTTIDALKEFGVNLTDAEGKFVGAYKAVELLSKGLSNLDPRSLDFSRIVEELGGFRQIGKVIPLIQQFSVAQEALKVAQKGQSSLAKDAATAQLSLANQISKVREEFFALFREIGQSQGFQTLIRGTLSLTSGLIKLADSLKGILPALAVITAFKGAKALTQFAAGFGTGVRRGPDGKAGGGVIRKFARGGVVPGTGSGDTVPAMLEPGEFVIRKKAVETIGADKLHKMNKYGSGGSIRAGKPNKRKKFAAGGAARIEKIVSIDDDDFKDGDTFTATVMPKAEPYKEDVRIGTWDAWEKRNPLNPDAISTVRSVTQIDKIKKLNRNKPSIIKFLEDNRKNKKVPGDAIVHGNQTALELAEEATGALKTAVGKRLDGKSAAEAKIRETRDQTRNARLLIDGIDIDNKYKTGRIFKNLGGKIQKFLLGGTVEETASLENMSLKDAVIAWIEEFGGIEGVKKTSNIPPGERTLNRALRAEKITSGTTEQLQTAVAAINKALQNQKAKKVREAQSINKMMKLGIVGLEPLGYSKDESFDTGLGKAALLIRGLPDTPQYADAVSELSTGIGGLGRNFARKLQNAAITKNKSLVLDFDKTLVDGADILGPDGKEDIPAYSDLTRVEESLKNGYLTPLGEKLKSLLELDPSYLDNIRVLTARPQSNANLLAKRLNELGIPIPANKITGISGGNKGESMISGETLIDDNIKNVMNAIKEGKGGKLYAAQLRDISDAEARAKGRANAEGAILELALSELGAYGGTIKNNAVDFEKGLGQEAAGIFGIPSDILTEVKRTLSGAAIGRAKDEFKRYFSETYGPFPKGSDVYSISKTTGLPVSRFAVGGEVVDRGNIKYLKSDIEKAMQGMGLSYDDFFKKINTPNSSFDQFMVGGFGPEAIEFPKNLRPYTAKSFVQEEMEKASAAKNARIQSALEKRGQRMREYEPRARFAKGGSAEDTVPALLTPGEFVINKKAAQKIGYGQLTKLNQADKLKGFNKGGAVGLVQTFADGGIVTKLLMDFLSSLSSEGSTGKKLSVRPDTIDSSTIEASSELYSITKELANQLKESGYEMKSFGKIIQDVGRGANISYADIEKAIKKDLERLKMSGASIEAITKAEKTLQNVRETASKDVVKKQFLEAGFKESDVGKQLGSGATQQKILALASKEENRLIEKRKKEIEKDVVSSGKGKLSPDEIADKVKEKLQTELEDIKTKAFSTATTVATGTRTATGVKGGISSKELQALGISGKDIQSYVSQSMRDRKTLAQMDKQLIAMKLEEVRNTKEFKNASAAEQRKLLSDAKALAKEEISKRREIINEIAKEQGQSGVGAAGLFDTRNSPILNMLKDRYATGNTGLNMKNAFGDIGLLVSALSGFSSTIAKLTNNMNTDEGKINAARSSVAMETATSRLGTGLVTASQLATIPGVGPYLAVFTALGTVVGTAADYFYDFTGAQKAAVLETQKNIKFEALIRAEGNLASAFKEFEKDIKDIDVQAALESAIGRSTEAEISASQAEIKVAQDQKAKTRTWPEWFFGVEPPKMDLEETNQLRRQQVERASGTGAMARSRINQKIDEGATIEQIKNDKELANSRLALVRADEEARKVLDDRIQAEGGYGKVTEERMKQIADEIAMEDKEGKANSSLIDKLFGAAIKARELAIAMEAANRAGRKLAESFDKLSNIVIDSVGRAEFEAEARQKASENRAAALRGESEVGDPRLRSRNVFDNPEAYSQAEFEAAVSSATEGLDPITRSQVSGQVNLQRTLPKNIEAAINASLANNQNLSLEDATKEAIKIANSEIDKLSLSDEQKTLLKEQAETRIKDTAEEAKKKGGTDQQQVNRFADSISDVTDVLGEFGKKALDTVKIMAEFKEKALSRFVDGLNSASKAAKEAADLFRKARAIENEANITVREVLTGRGESFEEVQSRVMGEVASLTGGETTVKGIKDRITKLTQDREGLEKERQKFEDQGNIQGLKENALRLREVDDKLRDTSEGLDILANSTEMADAALKEMTRVRDLQQGRKNFVNQLLTNTPEEADKLNQTFIRLQRNLSGGLNIAENQRDARKAFNQALRETGSVRQATRAGNTVLANQRKETLALSQDPGFRAAQELQIRNMYAMGRGQPGVSADEAVANYFKQQEAQLMKSMAIESGLANNPLVRQSIAAVENPLADPAMKAAADKYLQSMGLRKEATEAQAELKVAESNTLLKDANDNLRISIENLARTIEARGMDMPDRVNAPGGVKVNIAKNKGGLIYASDGQLINFEPKGSDTVPAMLTPGEFVINAKATSEHLPLLKAINSGYYKKGGSVSSNNNKFYSQRAKLERRKKEEEKEEAENNKTYWAPYWDYGKYRATQKQLELRDRGYKVPKIKPGLGPLGAWDIDWADSDNLKMSHYYYAKGGRVLDRDPLPGTGKAIQAKYYPGADGLMPYGRELARKKQKVFDDFDEKQRQDMAQNPKTREFNSPETSFRGPARAPLSPQDNARLAHEDVWGTPESKQKARVEVLGSEEANNATNTSIISEYRTYEKGAKGKYERAPGPLVTDPNFMSADERARLSGIMQQQQAGNYISNKEDIQFIRGLEDRVGSLIERPYEEPRYWNGAPTGGGKQYGKSISEQDPYWGSFSGPDYSRAQGFFRAFRGEINNKPEKTRFIIEGGRSTQMPNDKFVRKSAETPTPITKLPDYETYPASRTPITKLPAVQTYSQTPGSPITKLPAVQTYSQTPGSPITKLPAVQTYSQTSPPELINGARVGASQFSRGGLKDLYALDRARRQAAQDGDMEKEKEIDQQMADWRSGKGVQAPSTQVQSNPATTARQEAEAEAGARSAEQPKTEDVSGSTATEPTNPATAARQEAEARKVENEAKKPELTPEDRKASAELNTDFALAEYEASGAAKARREAINKLNSPEADKLSLKEREALAKQASLPPQVREAVNKEIKQKVIDNKAQEIYDSALEKSKSSGSQEPEKEAAKARDNFLRDARTGYTSKYEGLDAEIKERTQASTTIVTKPGTVGRAYSVDYEDTLKSRTDQATKKIDEAAARGYIELQGNKYEFGNNLSQQTASVPDFRSRFDIKPSLTTKDELRRDTSGGASNSTDRFNRLTDTRQALVQAEAQIRAAETVIEDATREQANRSMMENFGMAMVGNYLDPAQKQKERAEQAKETAEKKKDDIRRSVLPRTGFGLSGAVNTAKKELGQNTPFTTATQNNEDLKRFESGASNTERELITGANMLATAVTGGVYAPVAAGVAVTAAGNSYLVSKGRMTAEQAVQEAAVEAVAGIAMGTLVRGITNTDDITRSALPEDIVNFKPSFGTPKPKSIKPRPVDTIDPLTARAQELQGNQVVFPRLPWERRTGLPRSRTQQTSIFDDDLTLGPPESNLLPPQKSMAPPSSQTITNIAASSKPLNTNIKPSAPQYDVPTSSLPGLTTKPSTTTSQMTGMMDPTVSTTVAKPNSFRPSAVGKPAAPTADRIRTGPTSLRVDSQKAPIASPPTVPQKPVVVAPIKPSVSPPKKIATPSVATKSAAAQAREDAREVVRAGRQTERESLRRAQEAEYRRMTPSQKAAFDAARSNRKEFGPTSLGVGSRTAPTASPTVPQKPVVVTPQKPPVTATKPQEQLNFDEILEKPPTTPEVSPQLKPKSSFDSLQESVEAQRKQQQQLLADKSQLESINNKILSLQSQEKKRFFGFGKVSKADEIEALQNQKRILRAKISKQEMMDSSFKEFLQLSNSPASKYYQNSDKEWKRILEGGINNEFRTYGLPSEKLANLDPDAGLFGRLRGSYARSRGLEISYSPGKGGIDIAVNYSGFEGAEFTKAGVRVKDYNLASALKDKNPERFLDFQESGETFYGLTPEGGVRIFGKDSTGRSAATLYNIPADQVDRLKIIEKLEALNIPKFNQGGIVYANNSALVPYLSQGADTVPAMLTPGEFVVNREASQQHMPLLHAINSGHFTRGGIVNYLANGGIVAPKYYAGGGPIGGASGGVSTKVDTAGLSESLGSAVKNAVGQISEFTTNMVSQVGTSLAGQFTSVQENLSSTMSTFQSATQEFGQYASNIPRTLETQVNQNTTLNHIGLDAIKGNVEQNIYKNTSVQSRNITQNTMHKYDKEQFEGNLNTQQNNRPMGA